MERKRVVHQQNVGLLPLKVLKPESGWDRGMERRVRACERVWDSDMGGTTARTGGRFAKKGGWPIQATRTTPESFMTATTERMSSSAIGEWSP